MDKIGTMKTQTVSGRDAMRIVRQRQMEQEISDICRKFKFTNAVLTHKAARTLLECTPPEWRSIRRRFDINPVRATSGRYSLFRTRDVALAGINVATERLNEKYMALDLQDTAEWDRHMARRHSGL